jgi:hypothetical protein
MIGMMGLMGLMGMMGLIGIEAGGVSVLVGDGMNNQQRRWRKGKMAIFHDGEPRSRRVTHFQAGGLGSGL